MSSHVYGGLNLYRTTVQVYYPSSLGLFKAETFFATVLCYVLPILILNIKYLCNMVFQNKESNEDDIEVFLIYNIILLKQT